MTRLLPGVYVKVYDLSTVPESGNNLTVGYVLKADRGPINKCELVTSAADFLNKYTFTGQPKADDDTTFWSILQVLKSTNRLYVSRAAKNPLYGGLVFKKDTELGAVTATNKTNKTITVSGTITASANDAVRIYGSKNVDGRYTVVSAAPETTTTLVGNIAATTTTTIVIAEDVTSTIQAGNKVLIKDNSVAGNNKECTVVSAAYTQENTVITVSESLEASSNSGTISKVAPTGNTIVTVSEDINNMTVVAGYTPKLIKIGGVEAPLTVIGNLTKIEADGRKLKIAGDKTEAVPATSYIKITDCSQASNNQEYKVVSSTYKEDLNDGTTIIVVDKDVTDVTGATGTDPGKLNMLSIVDPENYQFDDDDLFVLAGVDPGKYNNSIGILVVSYSESPDELTEKDTFTIAVYDADTRELLENPWVCSRNPEKKATDGSGLFLDDVLAGSAYIQGKCNTAVNVNLLPSNLDWIRDNTGTVNGMHTLVKGSNGDDVDVPEYVAALEMFADKTIPVSIIGNGSQENAVFQQALLSLVDTRKDCVAFLNSRKSDEDATFNSKKATNVVSYKKDLGSTSYYGTMYAPHVNYPDIFNSRQIKIGADSIAISGWLNTINNQGYPYAFAGPTYGLVSGVTTNWKIGDLSGEAEILNDASINYIAYDAKVGRYYMQCQNTLQVANSSLRNLGAVFNLLDMKETFITYFKEYLQKPITTSLRNEILQKGKDYMNTVMGQGRCVNYSFVDATTDTDMDNNTLRYILAVRLTPYAQIINLTMNVVNSSYDFSITQ